MRNTLLAAAALVITTAAAHAAVISFAIPSGTLGTSQAYGPITAYGFTASTTGASAGQLSANQLYGKSSGGGETGLGLAKTNDNEINAPVGSEAIVLDVSALIGQDLQIGFGSVQGGEGWRVGFSSSTALPTNESAFSGYVNGTVDFPKLFDLGIDKSSHFLIAEATSGNVLLTSLSATTVPEPASLALLGAGLFGIGMIRRRKASLNG